MQASGKDEEGEDLELGQRIASKLSVGKGSPPKEPAVWINSSVFVDRRASTSARNLTVPLTLTCPRGAPQTS